MKILFVANSAWNLENFREDLIKNFINKGYEVEVLASKDNSAEVLSGWGCKYTEINFHGRSANLILELIIFLKLFVNIVKIRPDIILSFTIKPNIYCGILSLILSLNLIVNVTGVGVSIIKDSVVTKVVLMLYKIALRGSAYCFFQNNNDLDYFKRKKLVTDSKIKLIPGSGININKFFLSRSDKIKRATKTFNFLFLGRVLEEKGIFEFLRASLSLKKKLDVRVRVVGTCNMQLLSGRQKEFFCRLIKTKVISYQGFTENVKKIFIDTDCLVLPSYREGSSRAIMEALACEIPVIASNVPGCNNLVENNINGFLCNPRDAKDLTSKMILMYNLPTKKRIEMGVKGREKMKDQFDVKFIISAYNDCIDAIKE